MVGQAGGKGDAVVGGGLEVAPIGVGDDLYRLNRIGPGAIDGGIGDGIAPLQVFDGADGVLGSAIVPTRPDIAIPGGGRAVVAQTLLHTGVGLHN